MWKVVLKNPVEILAILQCSVKCPNSLMTLFLRFYIFLGAAIIYQICLYLSLSSIAASTKLMSFVVSSSRSRTYPCDNSKGSREKISVWHSGCHVLHLNQNLRKHRQENCSLGKVEIGQMGK